MSEPINGDRLTHFLHLLLPSRMAADLDEHGADDVGFIAEQVRTYLEADEAGRADMDAFHEPFVGEDGNPATGPDQIKDSIRRLGLNGESAEEGVS